MNLQRNAVPSFLQQMLTEVYSSGGSFAKSKKREECTGHPWGEGQMAKQPLGGERWGEEVSVGQSKQSASTNSSLLLPPKGLFLLRAPPTPCPKFDCDPYSAQTRNSRGSLSCHPAWLTATPRGMGIMKLKVKNAVMSV